MHKKIGPDLPVRISPGTLAGNVLFATNIPDNLETGEFVGGDSKQQAKQTFENMVAFAAEAGGSAADVAQITIFVVDETDLAMVNEAYNEVFVDAPYPTRATVVVSKLIGPPGMLLETTAIIVIG